MRINPTIVDERVYAIPSARALSNHRVGACRCAEMRLNRRIGGLSTPFHFAPDTYMEDLWVEK